VRGGAGAERRGLDPRHHVAEAGMYSVVMRRVTGRGMVVPGVIVCGLVVPEVIVRGVAGPGVAGRRVVMLGVAGRWMAGRGMVRVMTGFGGRQKPEAEAVQAGAGAWLESRRAGAGRQHRGRVRQHAAAQVRQGVNQGGSEHVARHAAHRIEPDREAHPGENTGTT
jgi:hypothetical protein